MLSSQKQEGYVSGMSSPLISFCSAPPSVQMCVICSIVHYQDKPLKDGENHSHILPRSHRIMQTRAHEVQAWLQTSTSSVSSVSLLLQNLLFMEAVSMTTVSRCAHVSCTSSGSKGDRYEGVAWASASTSSNAHSRMFVSRSYGPSIIGDSVLLRHTAIMQWHEHMLSPYLR